MARTLIIAHRGASRVAPENTLTAFGRAIAEGADGIEFDVRLTRDGVPVVIHDATLERTAGMRRRVDELTSDELAQIDVGSWFNRKFPASANIAFEKETAPTLEKTLEFLRDLAGPIYLEIKIGHPREVARITGAVAAVISRSDLFGKIIVQSFELSVLPQMHEHLPDIQTAALFEPRVRHFVRGRQRIIDLALQYGADHLSLHRSLVNKRMLALAAKAGLPVTVWTIDDLRWLARAVELGIYALITDNPASIRHWSMR